MVPPEKEICRSSPFEPGVGDFCAAFELNRRLLMLRIVPHTAGDDNGERLKIGLSGMNS